MIKNYIAAVCLVILTIVTVRMSADQANSPSSEQEATHRKNSWEWSDAERIAARLNDVEAAARVRAASGSLSRASHAVGTAGATRVGSNDPHDVIVGSRDPQLFLKFELFDYMVRLSFADDEVTRSAYREIKDKRRAKLGLPPDMWQRLEVIVAPYRADRRREREIALSDRPEAERTADLKVVAALLCRDRFAALTEAEAQFGRAFDRFLYTAVAPDMIQVIARKPDDRVLARVSGGCND